MTNELINKAKACQSPQELLELAGQNNIEMTLSDAQLKYAELHREGELSDDELDSASGGSCYNSGGYLKTTTGYTCEHFEDNGDVGSEQICRRCKWWDKSGTLFTALGEPAICKNPINKQ